MEVYILIVFLLLSFIISLVIGVAAWLLSERSPDKEKLSPYECGFDPFGQPGHPISIKFFLVAILFLIFDLEVVLLLPWAVSFGQCTLFSQGFVWVFLLLLVLGLVYEWASGGLEWE
nr:NADH dehydrogenase subunit 3 [Morbakka sp. MKL-2023]